MLLTDMGPQTLDGPGRPSQLPPHCGGDEGSVPPPEPWSGRSPSACLLEPAVLNLPRRPDAWVAQSVKRLTLDFSSGLDLRVVSSSTTLGSTLGLEPRRAVPSPTLPCGDRHFPTLLSATPGASFVCSTHIPNLQD